MVGGNPEKLSENSEHYQSGASKMEEMKLETYA